MLNAKQARANVNTELEYEVTKCLESIDKEIQSAETYTISVPSPKNHSVMLKVVAQLEVLGYSVRVDKYSDQRESWDNLIIKF